MLDPARLREMLGELAVAPGDRHAGMVDGEGAHARGACIDRDDHRHGWELYGKVRRMKVGMLTGGGDCPGLNAVLRAIVRKGETRYGDQLVGFHDGWRGVLEGDVEHLDVERMRGTLPRGGTILRSSRTNPYELDGGRERVKSTLAELGVDALGAIGGEDTLGVAAKLHADGVNVVGVPKTIDNDLSATELTFGFDTAVQICVDAIDRLHTTAESHDRGMGVGAMGRPP